MAERGEPADRHQEMQAGGKDHEDRDFRADRERVVAGEQRQRRGQHQYGGGRKALVRRQRPPDIDGQPRRAARQRLRPAKQAPWPHNQHHGHHKKHQDDGNLRENENAEGVELRYQHRRDKGAGDAAQPADHHHHEHVDDDAQVHGMMHGIARDLQRAAERGEKDPEREHAGEQPFLIDAECGHHVAVLGRGTHQHAPARSLEHQPQGREHDRAEPDQEQIVGRHILAEKINRALESRRASAQQIARPPDQHHDILDHQRQAERRQQLKQFRRVIDASQQHHFDEHADHSDDQRRGDDAAPKTDRAGKTFGQRERRIGAEHVERAMGEIDDARHAEDDRQTRRHEEQRRRAGKTGQELNDVEGHLRSVLALGSPLPARGRAIAYDGAVCFDSAFPPQTRRVLLPSPRAAAGRGRGWGVAPRLPMLMLSTLKHPPPPTPPHHALRARREGRRRKSPLRGNEPHSFGRSFATSASLGR